jgi:uncharacterized repeat protein (TIGR03803 family)
MFKKSSPLTMALCLVLFCLSFTQAQEKFWGIRNGVVFQMNIDGSDYVEVFNGLDPSHSANTIGYNVIRIIVGADNNVYGLTDHGGPNGYGTLFKITPQGTSPIRNLDNTETLGSNIVDGGDGYIYGVGQQANGPGSKIYRVTKDGSDYKATIVTVNAFNRVPGMIRTSGGDILALIRNRVGLGMGSPGYILKFKENVRGTETIFNFSTEKGKWPEHKMIQLSDGYLYGTTQRGGALNLGGVLYKLLPDGQGYTILRSFLYPNEVPSTTVTDGGDGFLYGLSGAALFRIRTDGTDFARFSNLSELGNGDYVTDLILGTDGDLYFSTANGLHRIHKDGSGSTIVNDREDMHVELLLNNPTTADVALINPADGATNVALQQTFVSNSVDHATSYMLQLSETEDFNSVSAEVVSNDEEFELPFALQSSTTYYARVKTNAWPNFGPVTQFTTEVVLPEKMWAHQYGEYFYANPDGTEFTRAFEGGDNKASNLFKDANGNLYGVAKVGLAPYTQPALIKISPEGITTLRQLPDNVRYYTLSMADGLDGFMYGITDAHSPLRCRLFKIRYDGSDYQETVLPALPSFNPGSGIIRASDGNFYGLSSGNGAFKKGCLYKFDTSIASLQIIYSFSGTDGIAPLSTPIEGPDGFLYGTARLGGSNNKGVLFKIDKSGVSYTKLLDFDGGNTGSWPMGNLLLIDEFFYGFATNGGPSQKGVLFKIKPDGSSFTAVAHFGTASSYWIAGLTGKLLMDDEGLLYSHTFDSNTLGGNTFRLKPDGTGFQLFPNTMEIQQFVSSPPATVKLFSPADGETDVFTHFTAVVEARAFAFNYTLEVSESENFSESITFTSATSAIDITGLEAGATYYARASTNTWPLPGPTTTFTTSTSTSLPSQRLWGVTMYQGATICGTNRGGSVFSLGTDGDFIVHQRPSCTGIPSPSEGFGETLILGNDGFLYGLTSRLFRIDVQGNYTSICDSLNMPTSFMSQARNGKLYVAVSQYRGNNAADVFTFDLTAEHIKADLLFHLSPSNIGHDVASAPLDLGDGYLYGVMAAGGTMGGGTIYKFRHDGTGLQVLHNFEPLNSLPNSLHNELPLRDGHDGYLYGVRNSTDINRTGWIYRIRPNGQDYTVLHNFTDTRNDGYIPLGGVLIIRDSLFGVTLGGGLLSGGGTVYTMHKNGSGFHQIHNLGQIPAALNSPMGSLVVDNTGTLYGMAYGGGPLNTGGVYKLKQDGSGFEEMVIFTSETGNSPMGSLVVVDEETPSLVRKPVDTKANATLIEVSNKESDQKSLYPNPFTSTFRLGLANEELVHVTITDINGRELVSEKFTNANTELGEGLATGMYFVRVIQGTRVSTFRVVKK